jgi:arylsulfatase A-like enzyme
MEIVVLDVPALHLGYLGCYGNDWVATPNIDRLASESVVFDRHCFDAVQPTPLAWTGHQPLPALESLPYPQGPTLGGILDQQNLLHSYVDRCSDLSVLSLQKTVNEALGILTARHAFTWVRFPSLAPPWDLPEDLLNSYCEEDDRPWPAPPHGLVTNTDDLPRLQDTYAAVVTYVDAQLGVLLDRLREKDQLDNTLVCLTAMTSLPLGEHGIIGYTHPWLHEELVHLPLLMRLPRGESAGLRLDALTQPVDLFGTFLEFLGIAVPPNHGNSLWPLLHDRVQEIRPFSCSGMRVGSAVEWSLRTRDWAFLLSLGDAAENSVRQAKLYVKPEDRWEVNDVRQHHLDLAEEMETTLRRFAAASWQPEPPGAEIFHQISPTVKPSGNGSSSSTT